METNNFKLYPADRNLAEYEAILPRIQDKTVVGHIRERLAQGQQQVSVLDIGCGKGIALCELILKFPKVKAYGLSDFDYRTVLDDPWLTYIQRVDYRVGDAHRLKKIFGDTIAFPKQNDNTMGMVC